MSCPTLITGTETGGAYTVRCCTGATPDRATMGPAVAGRGSTLDGDTLIGMADATTYAGKAERRSTATAPFGGPVVETC
ncbi:hypothetical protein [Micromonospora sp. CB01531]|uniref:hypothetical protein n=1 Tax=Micromonospora sp. CB01531 TaxID=1718947 RepID=UPI000939659B|nr:hypothetical protein [Micromonospora sp. CB01531]OKI84571.1 hypothetical protein A6A27_40275 [Micromonospora sp. CB01531]